MRTVLPEHDSAERWPAGSASGTPEGPWSIRLAGAQSAWPALELYEGSDLLDVVSSTRLAAQLLRGGRTAASGAGHWALAWGRLPRPGTRIGVEFSRRRHRRGEVAAAAQPVVTEVTSWCWVAVACGRFDRVTVRSDGRCLRRTLTGGR